LLDAGEPVFVSRVMRSTGVRSSALAMVMLSSILGGASSPIAWGGARGLGRSSRLYRALIDGEIVALDKKGRPSFQLLQGRMHVSSPAEVQRSLPTHCATAISIDARVRSSSSRIAGSASAVTVITGYSVTLLTGYVKRGTIRAWDRASAFIAARRRSTSPAPSATAPERRTNASRTPPR